MTKPSSKSEASAAPALGAGLDVDLVCDDEDRWCGLSDTAVVVQAAADALAAWPGLLASPSSVTIALAYDDEVAALNAQFRGKAKPTNVLSFPAGDGSEADFLGDIILAEQTVLREAADQGTPVAHHVQHLVVHGLLHLVGYDHETPDEAERMEALEIAILEQLGVSNPYTGELQPVTKE
jgi:probable rRNA maturation factor